MRTLLAVAIALGCAICANPVMALDFASVHGKTLTVKTSGGRTLIRDAVRRCPSESGYCLGDREITREGLYLAWNDHREYQWHDLAADGTGQLLYRRPNGNPTYKRPKRLFWSAG